MKTLLIEFLVLSLLPSIATAQPNILGRWALSVEHADTVPKACNDAFIDVTEDEVRAVSGDQVVVATYEATTKFDDTILIFSEVSVSDAPNCQGIPSEVVKQNFQRLQIWRPDGNVLKVYAPSLIMVLRRPKS